MRVETVGEEVGGALQFMKVWDEEDEKKKRREKSLEEKLKCSECFDAVKAKATLIKKTEERMRLNVGAGGGDGRRLKESGAICVSKVLEEEVRVEESEFVRKGGKGTKGGGGRSPSFKKEGEKTLGGRGRSPGAAVNFRIPREVIEKRLEELEELLRGWGEGDEGQKGVERSRRRRWKETSKDVGGAEESGRRCVRVKRYEEKVVREFMRRRREEEVRGRREEEERSGAEREAKERRLEELGRRVERLKKIWRRRRKVEEEREEAGGGGGDVEEDEERGVVRLVEDLSERQVRLLVEEFGGIVGEVCREFFMKVNLEEAEGQLEEKERVTVETEEKAVETEETYEGGRKNRFVEANQQREAYGRRRNGEGTEFPQEESEESSLVESPAEYSHSAVSIPSADAAPVSTPSDLFPSYGGESNELERSLWERSSDADAESKENPTESPPDVHSLISTFKLNLGSEKRLLRSLLHATKSPPTHPPHSPRGLIYSAVEAAVEEALRQFHIHTT